MPRRSCRRNKATKATKATEEIPIPEPIQDIKVVDEPETIQVEPDRIYDQNIYIGPVVKLRNPCETDFDLWYRTWSSYLDFVYETYISFGSGNKYNCSEYFDEFVEIGYLTTPICYRKNRTCLPRDKHCITRGNYHIPDHLLTPFERVQHDSFERNLPIFQSGLSRVNIETSFSKYLFGLEDEFVPSDSHNMNLTYDDHIMEDDIYFMKSHTFSLNSHKDGELEILSYDTDSDYPM